MLSFISVMLIHFAAEGEETKVEGILMSIKNMK